MKFAPKKKRQYIPPHISKRTFEEAKQFLLSHTKGDEQKVTDLIESMRREQQDSDK
jgi:hypothetical protein